MFTACNDHIVCNTAFKNAYHTCQWAHYVWPNLHGALLAITDTYSAQYCSNWLMSRPVATSDEALSVALPPRVPTDS